MYKFLDFFNRQQINILKNTKYLRNTLTFIEM